MERNVTLLFLYCAVPRKKFVSDEEQNGEEQSQPAPGREEECVYGTHSSPYVLTDATSSNTAFHT